MSIPAPDSFAPNGSFRQHHEVEDSEVSAKAFQQAWRVRSKLDRLLFERAITPRQWRCAVEFRALHEHAHRGQLRAHDPSRIKVDGGGLGGGEPCDGQFAARRLVEFRAALGDGIYGCWRR
jgi:hypothetical protein